MKPTEQFIKAKKNKKELRAFLVIQHDGDTYMRLCFDVKNRITQQTDMVHVDCPTEITSVRNYSESHQKINEISFHEYYYFGNHIETFLNAIKKDSNVSFSVLAFNGSDALDKVCFVNHTLFASVDKQRFMLSCYTGEQNLASPIR